MIKIWTLTDTNLCIRIIDRNKSVNAGNLSFNHRPFLTLYVIFRTVQLSIAEFYG